MAMTGVQRGIEARLAALEARHRPPWAGEHAPALSAVIGRPLPATIADLTDDELTALIDHLRHATEGTKDEHPA